MRREFENIWKDAFDGASVTPSDEVWGKVVASMDSGSSKRSWVTILLIAATVTVAFAFPLTIGNSEYELKPQELNVASSLNEISDLPNTAQSQGVMVEKVASNDQMVVQKAETAVLLTTLEKESEEQIIEPANEFEAEMNAETTIRMTEYRRLQSELAMGTDEYYILPIFRKDESSLEKNLLAYGNINSGRQTASSGLSDMSFLSMAADNELSSPSGLKNSSSTYGTEEGGTTFYIGGGAEIPVAKRLNLTAGLGYQNQRLDGTSNMIYEEDGSQYPLGIYDPINPGTVFLSESYDYTSINQFISLPLGAKFALVDKKTKFRIGLALSPDFMISHRVTSVEYGTNSTNTADTDYNTIQLTGLLGIDVLFPLTSNYGLALETGVRQGLVPNVKNGSQYTTSFNFGVILFYQIK